LARHVREDSPPVGVGERAYPRLGPALFTPGYGILCAVQTADLPEIRRLAKVECLQEILPGARPPSDTFSILRQAGLAGGTQFLGQGGSLLLYRQTAQIRRMADAMGWRILANPPETRLPWENKASFRGRLLDMGLPALQFEILELESLGGDECSRLMDRWGGPIVLQIPCFPQGGGRSSFVVREPAEIIDLRAEWGRGNHRGHRFSQVMASPWLSGISASMEGCVTPWGVLVSPLQLQLVDIPEVLPPNGFGRFCGHQWGAGIPGAGWVQEMATSITIKVGNAMAAEGYRGVFGLDFLVENGGRAIWALECNPRYTGAFPTLTLLQWAHGLAPLEAFHVMSWLRDDPVELPPELLEATSRPVGPAAQILLFNRDPWDTQVSQELPSGLYEWVQAEGKGRRKGPALPFPAAGLCKTEDFLILDGPPLPGHRLKPGRELERVARIIFFRDVVDPSSGGIAMDVRQVIQWVYRSLGLEKVDP
jgi:hypothetical protein